MSTAAAAGGPGERLPASPGTPLAAVATPALLLDLEAMERNIAKLEARLAANPAVRARPHAKAFKSRALLAHLPYERYCAQTVKEAESLVAGGCKDVLLTNQVVGEAKLKRLAALATDGATVGVLVDCREHVGWLEAAAKAAGTTLTAYVEVDAGQQRCGVAVDEDGTVSADVVALAQSIVASPSLAWGGLQCYHGAIQHVRDPAERRRRVLEGPVARARSARAMLAAAGIDCPVVSGGGTGTHEYEMEGGVHNEIQPGSFLFMDGDYGRNQDDAGDRFEQSLFVHATVISSTPAAGRRVLDAGSKACDLLSGAPTLGWPAGSRAALAPALAAVTYTNGGDEHGILHHVPEGALPVGATVQLVPSHCDPAVNQHAHFVCMRGGVCESVLAIDARGPGW